MRRVGDVDYDNDIAHAEVRRDEAQKKLEVDKATCSMLRSRVASYEEEHKDLSEQIDSIPAERLNIKKLLERKTQLTNNVKNTKENISELKQEIVDYNDKLQSYDDFLTTINIEELLEEKKQYDIFKRRYDDTINRARLMDNDYKTMSKKLVLLDEVPCGSSYVSSCKFIADAHGASLELPTLEKTIIEKIEEAKDYKEKIVTVDSAAMVALIDSYNETIIAKNDIEIEKRDNKVSIEKLFAKIKTTTNDLEETNNKISLYEDNKEAIQNIENLIFSRDEVQKKINKTTTEILDFEETLNTHNRTIGSLEQKVETLLEKKQELLNIRAEYAAYDLYMRCVHSNGIAYDIIKRRLPVINEEIAKTISNIVDFEVFFQEDGNKLDVLIKHPNYESRPIEMGSGAEKTLASMGIRLALLSVSSLPKGNIFILDEPGTSLDAENMEGFIRMLDLVKTYFKTVILISHLDSLKDIVDMEITIDKKDGYAQISQ
jgi:DNA repair exonuclease SbcCD ATPase subunit